MYIIYDRPSGTTYAAFRTEDAEYAWATFRELRAEGEDVDMQQRVNSVFEGV